MPEHLNFFERASFGFRHIEEKIQAATANSP